MAWTLSSRVEQFMAAAGAFLATEPIAHTALLTETAHLVAHPEPEDGRLLGWWDDGRGVAGALVQAPRHPPLLSRMSARAVDDLAAEIPAPAAIGVDAASVSAAIAAWPGLQPRHRLLVHQHTGAVPDAPAAGYARIADAQDRLLLHRWFDDLMAAHPDDPSDRAYVIDDPLEAGGIVLWCVDDEPVAMAGRSPVVAETVRLGPVHAPGGSAAYETAALRAAIRHAQPAARRILVLSAAADLEQAEQLAGSGFVPVAERVLLARAPG